MVQKIEKRWSNSFSPLVVTNYKYSKLLDVSVFKSKCLSQTFALYTESVISDFWLISKFLFYNLMFHFARDFEIQLYHFCPLIPIKLVSSIVVPVYGTLVPEKIYDPILSWKLRDQPGFRQVSHWHMIRTWTCLYP